MSRQADCFWAAIYAVSFFIGMAKGIASLSEAIPHYDIINYDNHDINRQHHVAKVRMGEVIQLVFKAQGRYFDVILRPDTAVFTDDVIIESSRGPIKYDTRRAYVGYLSDEPNTSYVHGIITREGIFEGKIISNKHNETYILERSSHHFKKAVPFHSVFYNHSSIRHQSFEAPCHSQKLHYKLQRWNKLSVLPKSPEFTSEDLKRYDHKDERDWGEKYRGRLRRSIVTSKTTCELYVQADHKFVKDRYKGNQETVIEQLTQHVQAVNAIYKLIDFDGNTQADSINFVIKRMKIHSNTSSPGYKFNGNFGVEKFLDLFSEDNFDSFCLAYTFTYRDFDGGTLGLAWTGDLSNSGGVCEKNKKYSGVSKSLNTGIVSVLNYNKNVPSSISQLTFAHEIGHNMGSPHDPETNKTCFPGDTAGNFIMSARATSGDKANNKIMSKCSIEKMAAVMAKNARGSDGCFVAHTGAICGNQVVEAGEDCDCGWDTECTETCCFKQTNNPPAGQAPCKFRNSATNAIVNNTGGTFCSPSQGDCCTSQCTFISANSSTECRAADSCKDEATCTGTSAPCPASTHKSDQTLCADGKKTCSNGECSGSLCTLYNMGACQCAPATASNWSDSSLCDLCCKPTGGTTCSSSYKLSSSGITGIKVQSGSPCMENVGFCDSLLKCRKVDPEGALKNLQKLFTTAGLATMKEWLIKYWYVVVASGIGLIILMVLFIKFCSVTVPSDREMYEKKKARMRQKQSGRSGGQSKNPRRKQHEKTQPKRNRIHSVEDHV